MTWTVSAKSQAENVSRRYGAIKRALKYEIGSVRWREEVATSAEELGTHPKTIARWVTRYAEVGLDGLANRQPANAGQPRVFVSLRFDGAFKAQGHDLGLLPVIAAEVDQKIKDIWASPAERAGVMDVKERAEFELTTICERHGIAIPPDALTISRRHVERFGEFRQVNVMRNDRKRFADGQPRIARDWTLLSPMAVAIADVHYVDVRVLREDGTAAYPKMICFKDGGTGRIWVKVLLLSAGRGVRQEDVIQAFIQMTTDSMWGFPETIYMDNGREFSCLERLREALAAMKGASGRTVIKAQPYNAAAKPVESDFSGLEQYLFSSLPGYAGSDRMKKKTQNVGKEPEAFPGTWAEFEMLVLGLVNAFNSRPGGEQWPDESPNQVFARKAGDGWRPTLVDQLTLDASFCTRGETRRIDRGTLSIGNVSHHHSELDTLPHRTELEIALPWRTGAAPLARMPDGRWVCLRPDQRFPAMSKEGIKEAAARQGRYQRGARNRAKQVQPYDAAAAALEMAARTLSVDAPEWGRELKAGDDVVSIATAQRQAAAQRAAEPTLAEIRARREQNEARRLAKEVDVDHYFAR